MKKITLLFLLFCSGIALSQISVYDFETPSEDGLTNVGGGITTEVVANPDTSGPNSTANCLKIGRTGTEWWIFAGIDVNDLTISSSENKYLSVWVYGPRTDLGCRFDATADTNNGTNGGIIRPSVLHSASPGWEQIIFPIVDSQSATNFTKGTLYKLVFHPDIGDAGVVPGGQILNNTDSFLYIDEIQILDSNPLSISNFERSENVSLYPNPAQTEFSLRSTKNNQITVKAIYNVLGSQVLTEITKLSKDSYDISSLSSGLYMVELQDEIGVTITKKLLKQ